MKCSYCGNEGHLWGECAQRKANELLKEQNEILKSQEERSKKEEKRIKYEEKAKLKAAQKSDPNYQSPTKRFIKFIFWALIFIFSFAGFAKAVESYPAITVLVIIAVVILIIVYFFRKFFKKSQSGGN